jgi:NADH:ubiquinone oxidoreductase subunit 2 (subunit N)
MITILITPLGVVLTNNWIGIWVIMEINNLSFTSTETKKSKKNKEGMIKYFLVQGISTSVMIASMIIINIRKNFMAALAIIILIIKIATAPIHQWFIEVVKNIETLLATLAITWQKAIPLIVAFYLNRKNIIIFVITTATVGAVIQIKIKNPMEILAASSVFNNGWSMISVKIRGLIATSFLSIYWITVWTATTTLKNTNLLNPKKWKEKLPKKWEVRISIANIGGFPPTAGFAAKAWLTSAILKKKISPAVLTVISITAINLYSYTKILVNSAAEKKSNKISNPTNKFKIKEIMLTSTACMIIISI